MSRNLYFSQSTEFKLGVCLYFLTGKCKGDLEGVADAGHFGRPNVLKYLDEFCEAAVCALETLFMPSTHPSAVVVRAIRRQFASRRGVTNVVMGSDGGHVPNIPQMDTSLLMSKPVMQVSGERAQSSNDAGFLSCSSVTVLTGSEEMDPASDSLSRPPHRR